jgi:CMP-2-keto-3-deoxyoctulosonic acid synthetase
MLQSFAFRGLSDLEAFETLENLVSVEHSKRVQIEINEHFTT